MNRINLGIVIDIKVKENHRTLYKQIINVNDYKKLAAVLEHLDKGFGIPINRAIAELDSNNEAWFK